MTKTIYLKTDESKIWRKKNGDIEYLSEDTIIRDEDGEKVDLYLVEKVGVFKNYIPSNIVLNITYENVIFKDMDTNKYVFDKKDISGGNYKAYIILATTNERYRLEHINVNLLKDIPLCLS